MIPVLIYNIRRQYCSSVCIDKGCQFSPFICNFCQDNQCQTIHIHPGKQLTKKWTEIVSLVGNYLAKYSSLNPNQNINTQKQIDQNDESNQFLIRYLQFRQYSNIMGKSMRSFYDSIIKQIKIQKQENLFQSKYRQKQYQEQRTTNSPDLQQFYLREGQKMFKYQKYQNALESFEKVININKNNHESYVSLKNISKKLQQQKQFICKYSEEINRDPLNSTTYIKRACLNFALKNYEFVLRDCDKAIQLDQYYSTAFYYRARTISKLNQSYKIIKDYSKAIMDYTRAIQINPFYCDAFYYRRIIYQKINEIQKALSDYNKTIDLDPLHYRSYYNRALICQKKLLIELALENYNEAIEINPKFIQAYFSRANLYKQKKQYNLALIDYNKVIQLNPHYWQAYNNRALLYYKFNQLESAIINIKKVIQLNYIPIYLLQIGKWQFKLHKYQLAEAHFLKYMRREGQNNKCFYYLGRIELQKGNLQLSAYLEKSIQVIAQRIVKI